MRQEAVSTSWENFPPVASVADLSGVATFFYQRILTLSGSASAPCFHAYGPKESV